MARRSKWFAGRKANQIIMMRAFIEKLPGYKTPLGLTEAEVAAAVALAAAFVQIMTETDVAQLAMKSANTWRDESLFGPETNKLISIAPQIMQPTPPAVKSGIMAQFSRFRDYLMSLPNYSVSIGEDLGLLGTQESPRSMTEITPKFAVTTGDDYTIEIAGSMQRMSAVRVEYCINGGVNREIKVLTCTPAKFRIEPAQPGQPESGILRFHFEHRNQEVGKYSPSYPVTLS